MNKRRIIAIVAVVVLLFVSIIFRFSINLASGLFKDMTAFNEMNTFDEEILRDGDFASKIAVINLDGVIQDTGEVPLFATGGYNHRQLLQKIDNAAKDDSIKAVILAVDSPGGGVSETAQIHRKLVEMKETYDKPFFVSMGNTAASGGYYVAAPADKIFAEASTLTGSIGVIMQNVNFSKLAENYGVDFVTIKSGKHKDIMSPSREMTKEEEDILQSMIDEMYDEFVRVIVDGRNMDESKVREVGDGRIYTGKQAKEVGLVDEVGNLDDAINTMMAAYDLEDAMVVRYGEDLGFFNFFGVKVPDNFLNGKSELDTVMSLLNQSDKPRAMYLY